MTSACTLIAKSGICFMEANGYSIMKEDFMSKLTQGLLVLCFSFIGFSQAMAQDEATANVNVIEVPNPDREVMDPQVNESPEMNRLMYVSIGQARAPKFVTQEFDFRPSNLRESIYSVRLVGVEAAVNITGAEVVLRNGQVFALNGLRGYLSQGRARRVNFGYNGVRVEAIRIWASSPGLIGSRGVFRVDTLVNR
jgi:hypothetical protein